MDLAPSDVLTTLADRFRVNLDFRVGMIAYLRHIGAVYHAGPSGKHCEASEQTAVSQNTLSPAFLVEELIKAGLHPFLEYPDDVNSVISFAALRDRRIAPRAIFLMNVTSELFATNKQFASDLSAMLIAAGRSPHNA